MENEAVKNLLGWEVGDVAVLNGYTDQVEHPLFVAGDSLVIVEISTNNPNILFCIKLSDHERFLADDPDLVGDEVWAWEVRRPNEHDDG